MFKYFVDLLMYQVDLLASSVRPMTAVEHDNMDEFHRWGHYDHRND